MNQEAATKKKDGSKKKLMDAIENKDSKRNIGALTKLFESADRALDKLTAQQEVIVLGAFRQERSKKIREGSCRKYLDALAAKLATLYAFKRKYKSGYTIGDVFAVLNVGQDGIAKWTHKQNELNQDVEDDNRDIFHIIQGENKIATGLPDLFTREEWDKLKRFDKEITDRVHSADLPRYTAGKPFVIIITHADYISGMIHFLQDIGVKATLYNEKDDLLVKDEDVVNLLL